MLGTRRTAAFLRASMTPSNHLAPGEADAPAKSISRAQTSSALPPSLVHLTFTAPVIQQRWLPSLETITYTRPRGIASSYAGLLFVLISQFSSRSLSPHDFILSAALESLPAPSSTSLPSFHLRTFYGYSNPLLYK